METAQAAPAIESPALETPKGTKAPWSLLLAFIWPLIFGSVLQSASQTMASLWVGRLMSTDALAAVSAVFPLVMLLVSLVMAIAGGGIVLIGQASGAGDAQKVKRIAGSLLAVTLLASVLVAGVGPFAASAMLQLLGTPANIFALSSEYARAVFLTMPVLATCALYCSILRGTGDAKTPLTASIVSTSLTILAAPLLILGWFGLPKCGVASVAIAALAGNAAALAGMLLRLHLRRHPLQFDREMFAAMRIDWAYIWSASRIGVPAAVQGAIVALGEIVILSFVNRFGSDATAGYGAIGQVMNYVLVVASSIGIAASVFTARAVGAGNGERVGGIVRSAVWLNYALCVPVLCACYALAWPILGAFVTDPHALELAHASLAIVLWSVAVYGNTSVLTGVMRGTGTVLWPTVIGIASVWVVEVPVAYVLMRSYGLNGVWAAGPVSLCATLALQFAYYTLFWKRNTHAAIRA